MAFGAFFHQPPRTPIFDSVLATRLLGFISCGFGAQLLNDGSNSDEKEYGQVARDAACVVKTSFRTMAHINTSYLRRRQTRIMPDSNPG